MEILIIGLKLKKRLKQIKSKQNIWAAILNFYLRQQVKKSLKTLQKTKLIKIGFTHFGRMLRAMV